MTIVVVLYISMILCRGAMFLVRVAHESGLAKMATRKWLRVPSYLFNVASVLFFVSRGQVNDQVPSSECVPLFFD